MIEDQSNTSTGDARRLAEELAEALSGRRTRRPKPDTGSNVHVHQFNCNTLITGHGNIVHTGHPPDDPHVAVLQQTLTAVLDRLDDTGLDSATTHALRSHTEAALAETRGVQPQPHRLRTLVGRITSVLARSASNAAAHELLQLLVRTSP